MHGVGLNEVLSGLVVSLALDSLDLCQEFCKQGAELNVVIYNKVCFAVANLLLNHLVLGALLIAPFGNELAVLHVGLRVGTAKLHAGELDHEAVADVVGVFGLVSFRIRHYAKLYHLGICAEVQAEEVCAGFLQGSGIFTHGGGAYTGQKLAGAVAQALVQVCVDFAGNSAPLLLKLNLLVTVCKLLERACGQLLGGIIVGVGDVGNGDAL